MDTVRRGQYARLVITMQSKQALELAVLLRSQCLTAQLVCRFGVTALAGAAWRVFEEVGSKPAAIAIEAK